VLFKDKHLTLLDDTYFDTTKVIMNFFSAHKLEAEFAKRQPITPGSEGSPPSEEEMAEKMAAMGIEHATIGKKTKKNGPSQDEIEKKLKDFQIAQEKIKAMNEPRTKEDDKDEL